MFSCQRLIVFDTEWTSWPGFIESGWNQPGHYREIVQIGAAKLAVDDAFREIDSFEILVQPQKNPDLSEYFTKLTGITQEYVDNHGVKFPAGLATFMSFIGQEPVQFACFGADVKVIDENCRMSGISMPDRFHDFVDVKQELLNRSITQKDWYSSHLPARLGLDTAGDAHDALSDARAVASAIRKFLGQ